MRENSVVLRRGLAVTEPENDEDFQEEEDLFRPPASFFAEPSDNIVAESRVEGGRLYVKYVKFYADALPTETDKRVGERVSQMLAKNEARLGPDYGDPFTGRIAAGYLAAQTEQPPPELPAPKPVERFLPVVSAPAKTFAAPRRVEEKRDMSTEEQLAEWHKTYKDLEKEHGREPTLKEPRAVAAPAPVVAPANEDPVIRVMREEAQKASERAERLNRALAALAGT